MRAIPAPDWNKEVILQERVRTPKMKSRNKAKAERRVKERKLLLGPNERM